MAKYRGNRRLSGTWAEVTYNGLKIAEVQKISLKVTVNREDVQIGLDMDTKIVGLKGEGTLSLVRMFSSFEHVRREIIAGRDPRGTIITKLADPDAVNGQIERYQIDNVALNEFPLEYEKGTVVKSDIPFGFTPTDMMNLDQIRE